MKININEIDKVKSFVKALDNIDAEIDLISGRYVINAKSIMGVFSLDLSKDIEIEVRAHEQKELDKFNIAIKPYLV